jgi:hypothetical protein
VGVGRSSTHASQCHHCPQECQVLKTFSLLCAILIALQYKAIHCLKRTWKLVSRWVDFSPQVLQGCHHPSMSPAANLRAGVLMGTTVYTNPGLPYT